ncbi:MAG: hypothetical protein U9O78_05150, partial [Patescibacteria group bacterium]|nr:hypothetical protein [Patescibacteria group bacterium]
ELTDSNLANLEELEKKTEKNEAEQNNEQMDLYGKPYEFNEDYIRMLLPKKNVFVVNQSMFRTPLDMIIVSHEPERKFVCKLIENSKLVDSWVKSSDKGFYSLDYTFWKGGKDRVTRSFNPDFFIKLDLNQYLLKTGNDNDSSKLRKLQNQGIKKLILVVEIKGDVEMDKNVVPAKTEAGKEHFDSVNKRLEKENPINFKPEFRDSVKQHYEFFLLRPEGYSEWFRKLEKGQV